MIKKLRSIQITQSLKQLLILTIFFISSNGWSDINIEMIDRTNLNTNPSTSGINKVNCEKAINTEFQNNYLGVFLCNKPLTSAPAANIPVFNFQTEIPHFQRNVRVDMIYMSLIDSSAIIKVKPDDLSDISMQMNNPNAELAIDCTSTVSGIEADNDQFFRSSFLYTKQQSQDIRLALTSTCYSGITHSYLRVSSIQVNINACHPSCLSCRGPLQTDCLTCATSNGAVGPTPDGLCLCADPLLLFQYGVCVTACDESKFLFMSDNKLCVFAPNCKIYKNQNCTECQISYFLINGQCLQSCPAGYVINGSSCVSTHINLQGGIIYLFGLWRNDFSMIEITELGIMMSNYLRINDNSPIFSRCRNINLLGGYFVNQFSSIIAFPLISNNKKFIKITFKYYIIDYTDSGPTNIFVKIVVGSDFVQKEIISSNTGQTNICGVTPIDIVGVFSEDFELPSSADFQISIINSNNKSKTLTAELKNFHSFFGIREIETFGFDCKFDFCLSCSVTGCDVCMDGYFLNGTSMQCEICSNNCKTCSSFSNCVNCKINFILDSATNQCNCIDGYYLNSTDNTCITCTESLCKSCNPLNPSQCTTCYNPKVLTQTGVCQDKCPDYQYSDLNRNCQNCLNTDCITCQQSNPNLCLSCNAPKVLTQAGLCQDKCPDYEYADAMNSCKNCLNTKCITCNQSNSNQCLSCISPITFNEPYLLQNGDCVNQCSDGFYKVQNQNICLPCTAPCKTCLPSNPSQCLTCFNPLVNDNGVCQNECGKGKVLNPITNNCESCLNLSCYTCSLDNKSECTKCDTGLSLSKAKDCVTDCGDQMYSENQICEYCLDNNCKRCKPKSTQCSSCYPPQALLNNNCVIDCGNGYIKDTDTNTCQPCKNSTCKSCDPSNTVLCISCQPPQVLLGNTCVDICGDSYYQDNLTNTCIPCPSKCKVCSDTSFCIECQPHSYNLNGYCLSQCPKEKFFENKLLNKCEQCVDFNCKDCSNDFNQCQQCNYGYKVDIQKQNICKKCLSSDCSNEDEKKDHNPGYPNETAQKTIRGILTGISSLMAIASPFYMVVSFFDLLQVTNYLVFINVDYSSTLYSFLQLFNFANFEIIPNIQNSQSEAPTKFKYEQYDTVIFSNLVQTLVIWLISFVLYLASLAIKSKKQTKIIQFFNYYRDNYRYNIIIGLGFLTYCDIVLSIFLQLYNAENIDSYNIAGLVCSIFFIILLIVLNVFAFLAATVKASQIRYKKAIQYFYDGIHTKKAFMNLIYLIRKTLIIQTLVFKQEYPIYQALQILLIIGLETTFMQIVSPYKKRKELILNFLGRVLILLSLTLITIMSLDDQINNINNTSRQFIEVIIILSLSSLYISQIVYIIYQFIYHK